MHRILIAEDEDRIAAFLEQGLRAAGYTTLVVADGPSAANAARDDQFDLMVLDLGLPFLDGTSVIAEVRNRGERMPILVLTARASTPDKVRGLELGADDYVTKPFTFDELLARVRVRLRDHGTAEPVHRTFGDVQLDLRTRRVSVGGRTHDLSAREFTLLDVLLRHPDHVLSREQLLSTVWGYDYEPGSNVVDVYVGYLRKKLGPGRIETVRGMGYRLTSTE